MVKVIHSTKEQRKFARASSKSLKKNKFSSEIWLLGMWEATKMRDNLDKWNRPIGPYIADLSNRKFGYIVEVDGEIHNQIDVKNKDRERDAVLESHGWRVFRIKAFNEDSFWESAKVIKERQKLVKTALWKAGIVGKEWRDWKAKEVIKKVPWPTEIPNTRDFHFKTGFLIAPNKPTASCRRLA